MANDSSTTIGVRVTAEERKIFEEEAKKRGELAECEVPLSQVIKLSALKHIASGKKTK